MTLFRYWYIPRVCIYIIMRSVLGNREAHEIGGVTSLKEEIGLRSLDCVAVDVNLLETLLLCRRRFIQDGREVKRERRKQCNREAVGPSRLMKQQTELPTRSTYEKLWGIWPIILALYTWT